MKNYTLFILVMMLAMPSFSQQRVYPKSAFRSEKAPVSDIRELKPENSTFQNATQPEIILPDRPAPEGADFVTIIDLGTSGNAYGYGYGGNKPGALWADDELKTITHLHRMGGNLNPNGFTGNLAYDISRDAGLTWVKMIPIYTVNDSAGGGYNPNGAGLPCHAIFNPEENTNPDSAWVSYTASFAGEDNSYLYGRGNIGNPCGYNE